MCRCFFLQSTFNRQYENILNICYFSYLSHTPIHMHTEREICHFSSLHWTCSGSQGCFITGSSFGGTNSQQLSKTSAGLTLSARTFWGWLRLCCCWFHFQKHSPSPIILLLLSFYFLFCHDPQCGLSLPLFWLNSPPPHTPYTAVPLPHVAHSFILWGSSCQRHITFLPAAYVWERKKESM